MGKNSSLGRVFVHTRPLPGSGAAERARHTPRHGRPTYFPFGDFGTAARRKCVRAKRYPGTDTSVHGIRALALVLDPSAKSNVPATGKPLVGHVRGASR